MTGQKIAHYKILEKLGEGGMGVVFKAEDRKLKRYVALKFLSPDLTCNNDAIQRFIQEAQSASALDHQNICTIYEIDESNDGRMFIIMAYYGNETLKSKMTSEQLTIEESIDIAVQVARGLAKVHEKGIIHRDIKPANLILREDGTVKIIDFGLSKLMSGQTLTKTGATKGTIAYMSPEQAQGKKVDHRCDVWALGVVLYQMLSGELPFKGEHDQVLLYSIVNEEPAAITDIRKDIPVNLERIVEKALQKKADKRYRSMDEMLSDLKIVRAEMASGIGRLRKGILATRKRRRLVIRSIIATLIIILVLIGNYFIGSNEDAGPVSIAVVGFENMTGNSTYNNLRKVLPNLFITSLEQSPHLQVTTWERLRDLLKRNGKESPEIIDKEVGFELCRLAGIDNIVVGSFTTADSLFVTEAKVLDVNSKALIKSASSKGIGVASILDIQIDEISEKIIRSVGVPVDQVEATQRRIVDMTTSSIEAYKYYIGGKDELLRKNWHEAIQLLTKATEIDSTFAMAYIDLAFALGRSGRGRIEGREAREKAMKYAGKATEKERMLIEAEYALRIERDAEKWGSILEQTAKKYPKEKEVLRKLGSYYGYRNKGMSSKAIETFRYVLELDPYDSDALWKLAYEYFFTREYDQALKYLSRYAAVLPDAPDPIDCIAEAYFRMGRIDEAIEKYEEAMAMDDNWSNPLLWYCYALKEDYAEALRWIDKQIPEAQNVSYAWKYFYHAWLGNLDQSLMSLRRIEESLESRQIAWVQWMKGWMYYDRGEFELSRHYFNAYEIDPERSRNLTPEFHHFQIGLVDIAQDRIDSAKFRLAEMKTLLPSLSGYRKQEVEYRYHFLAAEVLLAEGKAQEAITMCKSGLSHPVTDAEFHRQLRYNTPFLRDVQARAYYQIGELDKAIAEYERLTNFDPNSKNRYLIHPKYYYRLGKLYEETGIKAKAIARYEKFFRLWKDADKDLPQVIDAKNRLLNLKRQ